MLQAGQQGLPCTAWLRHPVHTHTLMNAKFAFQGGQDLVTSVTCCPNLFILVAPHSQVQQAAEAHLGNLLWAALRNL